MTLLLLYFLATLDGALCGCRASMGRCPLIFKRAYYIRSAVQGILAAQVASLISLAVLFLVLYGYGEPDLLRSDLRAAALRMMWIFIPFAAIVIAALILRFVPSTDIRSATSVFVLGPMTAIRPAVMVIGVVYGIWAAKLLPTICLGLLVLTLMLLLELTLNFTNNRVQKTRIDSIA